MTFLHIAIIILVVCVLAWFSTFDDEDDFILTLKQYTIICMILLSTIFIAFYTSEPTAMDVYQGKTTLEITYKDGEPVDSVVVWKGGEK